ncbi:hypothetical protein HYH03_006412 [Edaphochlamys debaryana]|uniref:SET domain-containing protein n=1 Tax=Edaphochlamys debaryana TaxID=47281 RepID=A0A835Y2T7_9CHLO|nr:hypothetical protein HYH03_006412 [Edaphochlamys debaryana]|eukprot:KAG2495467.1 hypothetical protein HYH03_006412 [Edaphochlamys debaryana]
MAHRAGPLEIPLQSAVADSVLHTQTPAETECPPFKRRRVGDDNSPEPLPPTPSQPPLPSSAGRQLGSLQAPQPSGSPGSSPSPAAEIPLYRCSPASQRTASPPTLAAVEVSTSPEPVGRYAPPQPPVTPLPAASRGLQPARAEEAAPCAAALSPLANSEPARGGGVASPPPGAPEGAGDGAAVTASTEPSRLSAEGLPPAAASQPALAGSCPMPPAPVSPDPAPAPAPAPELQPVEAPSSPETLSAPAGTLEASPHLLAAVAGAATAAAAVVAGARSPSPGEPAGSPADTQPPVVAVMVSSAAEPAVPAGPACRAPGRGALAAPTPEAAPQPASGWPAPAEPSGQRPVGDPDADGDELQQEGLAGTAPAAATPTRRAPLGAAAAAEADALQEEGPGRATLAAADEAIAGLAAASTRAAAGGDLLGQAGTPAAGFSPGGRPAFSSDWEDGFGSGVFAALFQSSGDELESQGWGAQAQAAREPAGEQSEQQQPLRELGAAAEEEEQGGEGEEAEEEEQQEEAEPALGDGDGMDWAAPAAEAEAVADGTAAGAAGGPPSTRPAPAEGTEADAAADSSTLHKYPAYPPTAQDPRPAPTEAQAAAEMAEPGGILELPLTSGQLKPKASASLYVPTVAAVHGPLQGVLSSSPERVVVALRDTAAPGARPVICALVRNRNGQGRPYYSLDGLKPWLTDRTAQAGDVVRIVQLPGSGLGVSLRRPAAGGTAAATPPTSHAASATSSLIPVGGCGAERGTVEVAGPGVRGSAGAGSAQPPAVRSPPGTRRRVTASVRGLRACAQEQLPVPNVDVHIGGACLRSGVLFASPEGPLGPLIAAAGGSGSGPVPLPLAIRGDTGGRQIPAQLRRVRGRWLLHGVGPWLRESGAEEGDCLRLSERRDGGPGLLASLRRSGQQGEEEEEEEAEGGSGAEGDQPAGVEEQLSYQLTRAAKALLKQLVAGGGSDAVPLTLKILDEPHRRTHRIRAELRRGANGFTLHGIGPWLRRRGARPGDLVGIDALPGGDAAAFGVTLIKQGGDGEAAEPAAAAAEEAPPAAGAKTDHSEQGGAGTAAPLAAGSVVQTLCKTAFCTSQHAPPVDLTKGLLAATLAVEGRDEAKLPAWAYVVGGADCRHKQRLKLTFRRRGSRIWMTGLRRWLKNVRARPGDALKWTLREGRLQVGLTRGGTAAGPAGADGGGEDAAGAEVGGAEEERGPGSEIDEHGSSGSSSSGGSSSGSSSSGGSSSGELTDSDGADGATEQPDAAVQRLGSGDGGVAEGGVTALVRVTSSSLSHGSFTLPMTLIRGPLRAVMYGKSTPVTLVSLDEQRPSGPSSSAGQAPRWPVNVRRNACNSQYSFRGLRAWLQERGAVTGDSVRIQVLSAAAGDVRLGVRLIHTRTGSDPRALQSAAAGAEAGVEARLSRSCVRLDGSQAHALFPGLVYSSPAGQTVFEVTVVWAQPPHDSSGGGAGLDGAGGSTGERGCGCSQDRTASATLILHSRRRDQWRLSLCTRTVAALGGGDGARASPRVRLWPAGLARVGLEVLPPAPDGGEATPTATADEASADATAGDELSPMPAAGPAAHAQQPVAPHPRNPDGGEGPAAAGGGPAGSAGEPPPRCAPAAAQPLAVAAAAAADPTPLVTQAPPCSGRLPIPPSALWRSDLHVPTDVLRGPLGAALLALVSAAGRSAQIGAHVEGDGGGGGKGEAAAGKGEPSARVLEVDVVRHRHEERLWLRGLNAWLVEIDAEPLRDEVLLKRSEGGAWSVRMDRAPANADDPAAAGAASAGAVGTREQLAAGGNNSGRGRGGVRGGASGGAGGGVPDGGRTSLTAEGGSGMEASSAEAEEDVEVSSGSPSSDHTAPGDAAGRRTAGSPRSATQTLYATGLWRTDCNLSGHVAQLAFEGLRFNARGCAALNVMATGGGGARVPDRRLELTAKRYVVDKCSRLRHKVFGLREWLEECGAEEGDELVWERAPPGGQGLHVSLRRAASGPSGDGGDEEQPAAGSNGQQHSPEGEEPAAAAGQRHSPGGEEPADATGGDTAGGEDGAHEAQAAGRSQDKGGVTAVTHAPPAVNALNAADGGTSAAAAALGAVDVAGPGLASRPAAACVYPRRQRFRSVLDIAPLGAASQPAPPPPAPPARPALQDAAASTEPPCTVATFQLAATGLEREVYTLPLSLVRGALKDHVLGKGGASLELRFPDGTGPRQDVVVNRNGDRYSFKGLLPWLLERGAQVGDRVRLEAVPDGRGVSASLLPAERGPGPAAAGASGGVPGAGAGAGEGPDPRPRKRRAASRNEAGAGESREPAAGGEPASAGSGTAAARVGSWTVPGPEPRPAPEPPAQQAPPAAGSPSNTKVLTNPEVEGGFVQLSLPMLLPPSGVFAALVASSGAGQPALPLRLHVKGQGQGRAQQHTAHEASLDAASLRLVGLAGALRATGAAPGDAVVFEAVPGEPGATFVAQLMKPRALQPGPSEPPPPLQHAAADGLPAAPGPAPGPGALKTTPAAPAPPLQHAAARPVGAREAPAPAAGELPGPSAAESPNPSVQPVQQPRAAMPPGGKQGPIWPAPSLSAAHLQGCALSRDAVPPPALQPGELRLCGLTFHPELAPGVRSAMEAWEAGLAEQLAAEGLDGGLADAQPEREQIRILDSSALGGAGIPGLAVTTAMARLLGIAIDWHAPLPEHAPQLGPGSLAPGPDEGRGGAGLFAAAALRKGAVLGVMGGYVMPKDAAKRLSYHGYRFLPDDAKAELAARAGPSAGEAGVRYAWQLLEGAFRFPMTGSPDGWELSMLGYGSLAALINDPRREPRGWVEGNDVGDEGGAAATGANCAVVPVFVRGLTLPVVVALRDIQPGEQLLRDYGAERWRGHQQAWQMAEIQGLSLSAVLSRGRIV